MLTNIFQRGWNRQLVKCSFLNLLQRLDIQDTRTQFFDKRLDVEKQCHCLKVRMDMAPAFDFSLKDTFLQALLAELCGNIMIIISKSYTLPLLKAIVLNQVRIRKSLFCWCPFQTKIPSMGLVYLPIHAWLIFMVNLGKYTIVPWMLWESKARIG